MLAKLVCRAWLETVRLDEVRYKNALKLISEYLTRNVAQHSIEKAHLVFQFMKQITRDLDPAISFLCDYHLTTRTWFRLPHHLSGLDPSERGRSEEYAVHLGRTEYLIRFRYFEAYDNLENDC